MADSHDLSSPYSSSILAIFYSSIHILRFLPLPLPTLDEGGDVCRLPLSGLGLAKAQGRDRAGMPSDGAQAWAPDQA
ncbi:unnamed protein product [Pleuronectes platessa]|uniref:Uncharacterized protein n=1 Tax=Pleuronectes platessa TaxID=8262 RepID=A0A9N7VH82_PLEPL|nr:unnamed protein product [Pleuronectes platessa]